MLSSSKGGQNSHGAKPETLNHPSNSNQEMEYQRHDFQQQHKERTETRNCKSIDQFNNRISQT